MTTFTDEDKELIKEIRERIGSLDVRDNIERRAYEIALASLEAEAVCVIDQSNLDYLEAGYDADVWPVSRAEMADVFLYRAVPPVPDKIALAIENLKQKLVECNRYNYCADAVKGVEDACLAAMRHGPEPVSQNDKLPELSDNYPVTPDGLSTVCAEAYQVVGVMADALGVFGDAAVQKVLDNLSQQKLVHRDVLPFSLSVTPDGWISCSERMPNDAQWCVVNTEYGYYVQCWSEGQGWLGDYISIPECDVINWMPLPEPPQEVRQ
ncbi:TPA: DUF551 domain-containing protein [Escherichia coli]